MAAAIIAPTAEITATMIVVESGGGGGTPVTTIVVELGTLSLRDKVGKADCDAVASSSFGDAVCG